MQSDVLQVRQTSADRIFTSNGETSDCTNWNCPIGQTYLQKVAPRKSPSIQNAARKYPTIIQAVNQGLFHKLNPSYAQRYRATSKAASHFERNGRGHAHLAGRRRRPASRTNVNGQTIQKKFPITKRAITVIPRQWVQGNTPARFIGLV